jgi:redox-regulated HSP33 family molecular chaperone
MEDFDENATAPEHLKGMVIAEINTIRDVMQIVQMFLGETMVAAVTLLQELEQKDE